MTKKAELQSVLYYNAPSSDYCHCPMNVFHTTKAYLEKNRNAETVYNVPQELLNYGERKNRNNSYSPSNIKHMRRDAVLYAVIYRV